MRIAKFSRKHALPLALLLTLVSSGCYALRNVAGGLKSIRVIVPLSDDDDRRITELALIVARGNAKLPNNYTKYAVAATLMEKPLLDDWLNFYEFFPPNAPGEGWSLKETHDQKRYLRVDEAAVASNLKDLDVVLQLERWNLEVDDEDAQLLFLAWFPGKRVETHRIKAGELREHPGVVRVLASGISNEAEADE